MGPGDVPKYPKEVSTKKMTLKKLNLKKWCQISETSPNKYSIVRAEQRHVQEDLLFICRIKYLKNVI